MDGLPSEPETVVVLKPLPLVPEKAPKATELLWRSMEYWYFAARLSGKVTLKGRPCQGSFKCSTVTVERPPTLCSWVRLVSYAEKKL